MAALLRVWRCSWSLRAKLHGNSSVEQHLDIPRGYMAHRNSIGENVVSTLHPFLTFSQPRIASNGRVVLEPPRPRWLSEFSGCRALSWFSVPAALSGPT